MTVVAWDGKTLAVDRIGNCEGWSYRTRKLWLFPKRKAACAFAGNLGRMAEIAKWVGEGCRRSAFPEFQRDPELGVEGLVVLDGLPFVLTYSYELVPSLGLFHAVGYGRDFALAAMALGHTAVEAVSLAGHLCTSCGKGVDWADCA